MTKADGTVQSEQGYYAYGRYRTGGTLPTDQKFTGQKLDGSGLYYMNARVRPSLLKTVYGREKSSE